MIKEHLSNRIQNKYQSVKEIETPQLNKTNVKPADTDNEESKEAKNENKAKKYNWRDAFDEFGNYIGENSESEEDTDDNE